MKRPPDVPFLALLIQRGRNASGVGIDLEDGAAARYKSADRRHNRDRCRNRHHGANGGATHLMYSPVWNERSM